MYNSQTAFQAVNFFISAKTTVPIPNRGGLVRDALIQTSLDPKVRAIDFVEGTPLGKAPLNLDAIVVERDDGRFVLDIVPGRSLRGLDEAELVETALANLGLTPIVVSAADIRREPLFSNARHVWACSQRAVHIGMRLRIVRTLSEDGPMNLDHLCSMVEGPQDPAAAVFALVCANLIEIEIEQEPLGPTTRVRLRS
jgi:hypothetical protein